MKFWHGFVACILLCVASGLYAQPEDDTTAKDLVIKKDTIYDPQKLSLDSVKDFEKSFTYDWSNYSSIAANKNKINQIEEFLRNTPPDEFKKLTKEFKEALGKILLKLGTFYTHYEKQPDRAIRYLNSANNYLNKRTDKAWCYSHLAYAYQQKYDHTADEVDQKQGLFFVNKGIQFAARKSQAAAYCFCVQALLENSANNTKNAQNIYQTALNMFQSIPGGTNELYQRSRTEYAAILLANDENDLALTTLQEIKKYWQNRHETNNPFAAKNMLVLGETYLKLGKPQLAQKEIKQAVEIYEKVYGRNNEMLMYPYQLLADAYKVLGNRKLADSYQVQANSLDQS